MILGEMGLGGQFWDRVNGFAPGDANLDGAELIEVSRGRRLSRFDPLLEK